MGQELREQGKRAKWGWWRVESWMEGSEGARDRRSKLDLGAKRTTMDTCPLPEASVRGERRAVKA